MVGLGNPFTFLIALGLVVPLAILEHPSVSIDKIAPGATIRVEGATMSGGQDVALKITTTNDLKEAAVEIWNWSTASGSDRVHPGVKIPSSWRGNVFTSAWAEVRTFGLGEAHIYTYSPDQPC